MCEEPWRNTTELYFQVIENKELMPRLNEEVGSNNTNRSEGMMVSVWGMSVQGSKETMEA